MARPQLEGIDKQLNTEYIYSMRYDPNRKTNRDKLLILYQKKNPNLSLREIGLVFGITRQRVCQILKHSKG